MIKYITGEKIKTFLYNHYSLRNIKNANYVKERLARAEPNFESFIIDLIQKNEPLLIGRLGGLEASCIGIYLDSMNLLKSPVRFLQSKFFYNKFSRKLCNNAGVYPVNKDIFEYFCAEHIKSAELVDVFSVWGKPTAWVESIFLDDQKKIISTWGSFPWFESRDEVSPYGWGTALASKKVLVVSPFIDSIKVQVPNLKNIFSGIVTPEIDFKFLKAPMSQGGINDGKSYKVHLLKLKETMESFDFDIALVSAGAYSLPLAAHAKKLGKVGVHAGGVLQLFFGISGKRYENYPIIQKYLNSYWKRPFEHERPPNWRSIEDGCYW